MMEEAQDTSTSDGPLHKRLKLPSHQGSTDAGYKVAQGHYNHFLRQDFSENPFTYDSILEDHCCTIDHWEDFGIFLVDDLKKSDGDFHKHGSLLEYLSGAKETIRLRFKGNQLWLDEDWYSELRQKVVDAVNTRTMLAGIPITEISAGIGRFMMKRISHCYMIEDKVGSPEGARRRFLLVMGYLACGRAGEAAKSSVKLCKWDHLNNCVQFYWQEFKTGKLSCYINLITSNV